MQLLRLLSLTAAPFLLATCGSDPDAAQETGLDTSAANSADANASDDTPAAGADVESADAPNPQTHDAKNGSADGHASGGADVAGDTSTADAALPDPCVDLAEGEPCDDGNPCTVGDSCKKQVCRTGKVALECDDADPCTTDGCHPELACWHESGPTTCDDGNPCTTDSCAKATGCANKAANPGDPCAVDACMIGQTCSASLLCLGGQKRLCDDDNACTDDSCNGTVGCVFKINSKPCADGHACTIKDSCNGGTCVGQKTNTCPICNKIFEAGNGGQLNSVLLGTSGKTGHGINVDGDLKTCAPAGSCHKGIDNSLGAISFGVNKPLANAMKAGTMRFLVDMAGYKGEGKPFSLRIYYGNLTPGSASCDWAKQPCSWLVTQQSMGPKCEPLASFDNAVVSNGKLTAGGPDEIFALEANLSGDVKPTFYIKGATIHADVEIVDSPGVGKPKLQSLTGIIGGAMTETAVMTVFNALPEANFKPLTKESALKLVKQLLVLDIDVDGDGVKDAASLGLQIKGIGAHLLGMSL